MKNLFRFYWPVDQGGYSLVFERAQGKTILGSTPERWVIKPNGGPAKEYDPINEYPALHRILAETDPADNNAILKFVSQFGLLNDNNADLIEDWRSLIVSIQQIRELIDTGANDEAANLFNQYISPRFTAKIDTSKKPKLVIAPVSLYGSIWFLVADEITTGVKFFICEQCGIPFHLRSNKRFCGEKCRKAWNYKHTKEQ